MKNIHGHCSPRRLFVAVVSVFLAGATVPVFAATLERGPYLQIPTPTSITIKWRTDIRTDAIVYYGTTLNTMSSSSTGANSGLDHEVTLSNLSPSTRYYYSIGDSVGTIAGGDISFTFQTSPEPDTEPVTRVWVVGDSGMADNNAASVRDAFKAYTGTRGADLWLMLGDNAYVDGTDLEYQQAVFDTYPELLRQTPLWPSMGNHDGHSADSETQTGTYYDIFSLPTSAEAGGLASGTEAYYSFDYGNIHFIALDSYDSDRATVGAMLTWLNNDLAATSKTWIIAFWHHPPYTKGSHDSDSSSDSDGIMIEMRTNVLPILESLGVDLVLTGHSHSYERSYLIDGHYGFSGSFDPYMQVDGGSGREDDSGIYTKNAGNASNQGAVYAVVGSSARTGGGSLDHPAMYASHNSLGSLILDIDGNRLDARFIDETGSVRDYFSISKGEITNTNDPPMFTSIAVTNATELQPYTYDVMANDPDAGDTLSITATVLPTWLTLKDNGDGTARLSGTPTSADIGSHNVELQVQENAPAPGLTGNQQFDISVIAADTPPVITLLGDTIITIVQGSNFTDPGATAYDVQDGDLTDQITVDNQVNIDIASTYLIIYSVVDSAGNRTQVQRTVVVRAQEQARQSGGGAVGFWELFALLVFGSLASVRPNWRVAQS